MKLTIKEIAKESGYGVGTVSRVLNGSPNVSKRARETIQAIIDAHNYQPNQNARRLKQQIRQGIAIIVKGTNNFLFTSILEKLQADIEQKGYLCSIHYIDQDDNEVEEAEKECSEEKPCALVFLGANIDGMQDRIEALEIPCILVTAGAAYLNVKNLSSVTVDDTEGAICATDFLISRGHRKIGIIGSDPQLSRPSLLRLSGAQSSFMRHGIPFRLDRQFEQARFSLQDGYDAMIRLLRKDPDLTAVFAFSDIIAIGAMKALYDSGYKIPEDVSIIGYDGIELSRFCHPRLASIVQNAELIAAHTTDILTRCIEGKSEVVHEVVAFELQEGSSVRDIRNLENIAASRTILMA